MTVTIRSFGAGDDDGGQEDAEWAATALYSWDPALPREIWLRIVRGETAPVRCRVLAEVAGERVGLALANEPEGLAYPLVTVLVAPGFRGRGIGSALLSVALPTVASGDVGAGMPDGDDLSRAIAEHWGFEELGHGIDSVLDLDEGCGPARAPEHLSVHVVAGSDVDGSGWDMDAFLDRVGDFPESEIYGSRLSNSVLLTMAPDLVWILVVDDAGIAAVCSLMPQAEDPWYVGFTGSDPRVRGKGLARLAKESAHAYAFAHGARSVRTTNEERNTRMRALNAALGYRPVSGDLRLIRRAR